MQVMNMVGGEALSAHSGETLENLNPATTQKTSDIPRSGLSDVDHAVNVAQKAYQQTWRQMPSNIRADFLDAVANKLVERSDEFALAESMDTGKPFHLARTVDIPRAIANFRFFAGAIRHDKTGCHMMSNALN